MHFKTLFFFLIFFPALALGEISHRCGEALLTSDEASKYLQRVQNKLVDFKELRFFECKNDPHQTREIILDVTGNKFLFTIQKDHQNTDLNPPWLSFRIHNMKYVVLTHDPALSLLYMANRASYDQIKRAVHHLAMGLTFGQLERDKKRAGFSIDRTAPKSFYVDNPDSPAIEIRPLDLNSYEVRTPGPMKWDSFQVRFMDYPLQDNNNPLADWKDPHAGRVTDIYYPQGPLHQKDLDVFNAEYLNLLQDFEDDLAVEILEKVTEAIDDQMEKQKKGDDFRILKFISLSHNLTDRFIGLEHVFGNKVQLVYPAQGGAYIKVKLRIYIKAIKETTDVKVTIKGLKVKDLVHLQHHRDGHVEVIIPDHVKVSGKVDVDVSNVILDFLVDVVEFIFDPLSKMMRESVAEAAKENLEEDIKELQERSLSPLGKDRDYGLHVSENVLDKRLIVDKIEDRIFKFNLPFANITSPILDEPDVRRFLDYKDMDLDQFPSFSRYTYMNDGAIWTGTLLSAMALKYQSNPDQKTKSRIMTLLDKINVLARVNGDGPLARAAVLEGSPFTSLFNLANGGGVYRVGEVDGQRWASLRGENGITRDQYMGVMTGLINTFFRTDDVQIKKRARQIYCHLLDYLIAVDWKIYEDSNREVSWSSKTFPTNWAGIGYQKFTYLYAGYKMFDYETEKPAYDRYYKEYRKAQPLIKTSWINAFIAGIDPWDGYYSYNLEHTTILALATVLDERLLKRHLGRMVSTLQYFSGHHKNPYFAAIRYIAGKQLELDLDYTGLRRSIDEDYNETFYRPHTTGGIPADDLQYAKTNIPFEPYPKLGSDTEFYDIAYAAVSPRYRFTEEFFLWQRSPFYSHVVRNTNVSLNTVDTGLSLLIVEWLVEELDRQDRIEALSYGDSRP